MCGLRSLRIWQCSALLCRLKTIARHLHLRMKDARLKALCTPKSRLQAIQQDMFTQCGSKTAKEFNKERKKSAIEDHLIGLERLR